MQGVYGNLNGQVFKNIDGMLFKQPYDFGNCFMNKMALNNYMQVTGLSIASSGSFSIGFWTSIFSNIGSSGTIGIGVNLLSSTNHLSVTCRGTGANILVTIPNQTTVIDLGSTSTISDFIVMTCNNNSYSIYKNGTLITTSTGNTATFTTLNAAPIYPITTSLGTTISAYSNALAKLNQLFLFTRVLALPEIISIYSNKMGSELNNRYLLQFEHKNNIAESLDFSTLQNGTDIRCGTRDFSGNNKHAEIINLPAGTVADKVTYVNTNIFNTKY